MNLDDIERNHDDDNSHVQNFSFTAEESRNSDNNDETTASILSISRSPNPFTKASFFSKLFFIWPFELMKIGLERPILDSDLPELMIDDTSNQNHKYFEKLWFDELKRVSKCQDNSVDSTTTSYSNHSKKENNETRKPNLHRALLYDFFRSTWLVQVLMAASSTARIVMCVALGRLIEAFVNLQDKDKKSSSLNDKSYLWASVLIFSNFVVLMEHHHVFFITWRKGMKLRVGAVATIFAKSLRLSSISNSKSISTGNIMSLVSTDVERLLGTALFISYLVWAPIETIAVLIVGYFMVGGSFVIGISVLVFVFVPLQIYLSKRFAELRSKIATITDSRMTLVSQAILGVRVMKMSGWEHQFESLIAGRRAEEVVQIQKANRLRGLNEAVFFSVTPVVSIIIFVSHVLLGGTLTARNVFTIMSFINVLQLDLSKHFSLGLMYGAECLVSISRIQRFLESPEISTKQTNHNREAIHDGYLNDELAVKVDDISCYWNSTVDSSSSNSTTLEGLNDGDCTYLNDVKQPFALDGISIDLKMKELTFVIGAVGSGKSALLLALAGELNPHKGTIYQQNKSISYAPQDPWIENGSIRENILMGLPFVPQKYEETLLSCGLDIDLQQFQNSDETIVGDRGVQLSGGQRARISLARALYRDADILLLDDPLSAVDSTVGRLIFDSAIQDLAIKRGKCVVLATHQHQYINNGDQCVLMANGKAIHIGDISDCITASCGMIHRVTSSNSLKRKTSIQVPDESTDSKELTKQNKETDVDKTDSEQEERRVTGVVTHETFLNYARAMGSIWVAIGLGILFTVTQAAALACIAVIGWWSERPAEDQRSWQIISIVASLGASVIILSWLRSIASFSLTIKASKILHDAMTNAVLRAKIDFFDTNPSGRILNRFGADVGSNDDLLPQTLFDFLMCMFIVLGALVTAIISLPFILVAVPPLLWYFLRARRIFVTTSRELKRLEGLARSPIFATLNESISGVATIRVNSAVEYVKKKFEDFHDCHTRAFFSFLASSRWVGFRMDALMFVNVSLSCILAVVFSELHWFNVDPVIFGLALSMLMQLGSIFQWTIRQSAEVVNQMVSVERVHEYSKLDPEAALNCDYDHHHQDWPSAGAIQVRDLTVRYRQNLPLSLRGVSFDIKPGQRIAVVGRTGSGKSTLVQALFRILEAECGSIIIDNVPISKLGLHKLRRGMSVINQYPVLFSGCSVRDNLDPFHLYSDESIKESLGDVQMLQHVESLPDGIHSYVAESGSNFSVGERQLLCLARAMLQKCTILVLDEPTANVDKRTDSLLQKAVKKSFQNATIISIAHRLETIIDYDIIFVLNAGLLVEYGPPLELLQKEGYFAKMIHHTGSEDLETHAIEKIANN